MGILEILESKMEILKILRIFDQRVKFWTFLIRRLTFCVQKSKFSDFFHIFTCTDPWKLTDSIRRYQLNETGRKLLIFTEFFDSTDITELLVNSTDISNLATNFSEKFTDSDIFNLDWKGYDFYVWHTWKKRIPVCQ